MSTVELLTKTDFNFVSGGARCVCITSTGLCGVLDATNNHAWEGDEVDGIPLTRNGCVDLCCRGNKVDFFNRRTGGYIWDNGNIETCG